MAFDWGSLAGAAVSLYGAKKGADAAKSAGNASAAASEAGNKVIWDMFQQSRQDQMPAIQAGNAARNEYMQMMGLSPVSAGAGMDPGQAYLQANPDVAANAFFAQNPQEHYRRYGQTEGRAWGAPAQQGAGYNAQQITDKLRSAPGYGFAFSEGQRGVESSAAARGGLFSGAAAKALTKYGQGMADQQYGTHLNRLGSLAGLGQTATTQVGNWGQGAASNVATGLQNAGAARASGIAGAGQAWQQGIGDAAYFGGKFGQNQGWWG
jgi:hypothetical protein